MAQRDGLSDDEIVLLVVGVVGAPILIGMIPDLRIKAVQWALEHELLVNEAVLFSPPGCGPAGLDIRRVAILVAVIIAVVGGLSFVLRRRRRQRLSTASSS
jgi:hypothetical protein